jgi:hypothetical protein
LSISNLFQQVSSSFSFLGPFGYLKCAATLGVSLWYYDYWRRRAMEHTMVYEDINRKLGMTHYLQILVYSRALNSVRVGEEESTTNLMEYVTKSTTR